MSAGSFVKQRGKTWSAYWYVMENGVRRQKSEGGFTTKREAQAKESEMAVAVARGTYVSPSKLTVGDYLTDHWLKTLERRPATLAQYGTAVRSWIAPHLGGHRLDKLTASQVRGLSATLRASGGKGGRPLGDRSVQLAHVVLRAALEEAVRDGVISRNPAAMVRRPQVRQAEMSCWTAEEARGFLSHVADDRLSALWALLLLRGLRRGEALGLRWADVDLDAGRLSIRRTRVQVDQAGSSTVIDSVPKTAAGVRTVPLDPALVAMLRAHRAAQAAERLAAGPAWAGGAQVFLTALGEPLRPATTSARWGALVRASGQPVIRLHDARHTAATLALRAGIPTEVVSRWLGHSRASITQDLYQHAVPQLMEHAGATLTALVLGGAA